MPVTGLTRAQIRQIVARNLMGSNYVMSSPTNTGSTETLEDESLRDATPGEWILGTAGTINGDIVQVAFFEKSAGVITVRPDFSAAPTTAHTYEKFDNRYSPALIHDAINQAIDRAAGRWYSSEESLALHADGKTLRFDAPSEFAMINKIEFRKRVSAVNVHLCNAAWDESVDSDFTVVKDTKDYKRSSSVKFTVAATVSDGDIVTDSIESKNLSGMTHLEFWAKSSVDLVAADLKLLLDDTAGCVSPLETLSLPALTADVWTYCRVALANPELDTAIISVGLEFDAHSTACTLWLDDIIAVNDETGEWVRLPKHCWRVDRENDDVVLTRDGVNQMGYALLKLSGGSNPTRLTADADVCDLPEQYLVNWATAFCLMAGSRSNESDADGRRSLAQYWVGAAAEAERKFTRHPNIRRLV